MDYERIIAKAIDFIEERLLEDIGGEDVAAHVGFSPYHFHRIFRHAAKITIADYIRKRRLTHAARELFSTDARIIDLAVKYRFESQESFTRAFARMFRIPPGKFRGRSDLRETMYPLLEKKRLDFKGLRHLREGVSSEPLFVERDGFHIVGVAVHNLELPHAGLAWSRFLPRIAEIPNRTPGNVRYAVIEPTGKNAEYYYIACTQVDAVDAVPEGMIHRIVPANRYAVFTHRGAVDKIVDTFEYIYGTWLPKSGRRLAAGLEFAELGDRYRGPMSEASEVDIYIPIDDGADPDDAHDKPS